MENFKNLTLVKKQKKEKVNINYATCILTCFFGGKKGESNSPRQVRKLNNASVRYFISLSGCPNDISVKEWKNMGPIDRLRCHLGELSNGLPYTFELI